jgi:uncharacterized protein
MDKNEALISARKYASKIAPILRPEQIILYGSFANGTARENSDIDIAIVVKKITGDYLDTATMLYKMRREIDDRIEPVLLEESSDRSGFLSQIRKTGFMVFERG